MRNVMAALAALLVALPAAAQVQVTPYNGVTAIGVTGTLTTSGDTVVMDVSGSQWASVVWNVVGTAGTAGSIVAEVSSDYRVNWTPAAGSKRLSIVTANPAVSFLGAPLGTGQIWETPLPANATSFRVRCAATGTTTTLQLQGGAAYAPGTPVVAVLYETAVTAGANNNTPAIDVSGWSQVAVSMVVATAATGAASLNVVDDTGAALAIGTSASIAIGTYAFGWGSGVSFGTANPFTMVGGVTQLPLDRRFSVAVAGATTSAVRTRVVARR